MFNYHLLESHSTPPSQFAWNFIPFRNSRFYGGFLNPKSRISVPFNFFFLFHSMHQTLSKFFRCLPPLSYEALPSSCASSLSFHLFCEGLGIFIPYRIPSLWFNYRQSLQKMLFCHCIFALFFTNFIRSISYLTYKFYIPLFVHWEIRRRLVIN